MHLIMFDLDGTLLKSTTLDIHCFAGALSSVLGIENFDSDWTDFKYVTDEAIVSEIVARQLKRPATPKEKNALRTKVLQLLQSQTRTNPENFAPIPGALDLFTLLQQSRTCAVAIATGCWQESALLKLSTAGFETADLPIASADDSHRREDIMRTAYTRALDLWGEREFETVTYVGDGVWDLNASRKLGYHFIGIGFYDNGAPLRQQGVSFILNDFQDQKAFSDRVNEIWNHNRTMKSDKLEQTVCTPE
jgi:phosphoglycolate phosphatase-like HAD superfamily hydrolase